MPRVVAGEIVRHADLSSFPTALMSSAAFAERDLVLVIEASTAHGSVALFRGDVLVQRLAASMGASRDDALFPAVQAILEAEGVSSATLSAVVCGAGPGSFTSLRIAAAVAKGLSQATGAAMFAVPSLLLAAAACETPGDYLVHADALRDERYAMQVRIDDARMVHAASDVIRVTLPELSAMNASWSRLAVHGGAAFPHDISVAPDASHLMRIADWRTHGRVVLESWEPAYGRLAEAQVKWEVANARPLPSG